MDRSDQQLSFPLGVDDYSVLVQGNYVYVDKTLFIKEFWKEGAPVVLITRPRRFGKTLSLSMLQYFFENTEKPQNHLFINSKIWQEKGFPEVQGTYPVIFISFKDVKCDTWEDAYEQITELLVEEIDRVLTPIKDSLSPLHKKQYETFITESPSSVKFAGSLKFITAALKSYYDKKVLILIDEYDTPITHSYLRGYYEKMVAFMRNLLSSALKSNKNLCRACMTGVVRTAKDGIVSGLNNPAICTMLDVRFADKFGFTGEEVRELLAITGRREQETEVKNWYNGYTIGVDHIHDPATSHLVTLVYNPWSILSYLRGPQIPKPYWVRTGSTELLEKVIADAGPKTQEDLKLLMEGKSLKNKIIDQDIILLDLSKKDCDPWSFLLFAGYITAIDFVLQDEFVYELKTPNKEIADLYKKLVTKTIQQKITSCDLGDLLKALIEGHVEKFGKLLQEFIINFCSFYDLPENDLERSLHLFVLGLLASLSDRYAIDSNLESGKGRYDICLSPKLPSQESAILLEFKKGKKEDLERLAQEALDQIEKNLYATHLKKHGYLGSVICYGIASYKKEIFVRSKTLLRLD